MTTTNWTRRTLLQSASVGGLMAAGAGQPQASGAEARPAREGHAFSFALNTSTISGQKLPIAEAFRVAAKAGYDGIEPWIRELDAHTQSGGSLDDLGKLGRDLNLRVVDAIGFFDWAVDDDARRKKGLEEARRNFEQVARVGGTRLAAPPFGASDANAPRLDLARVAERYRALLELGKPFGVVPIVEVWGFARNLTTLGEAAAVAIGADHPDAAILADVYHLHKGGSGIAGLDLLGPNAVPVLHINDYPARPRAELADADRVYPGDGVAPLTPILRALNRPGSHTALSLEVFNRDYWKLDAATVAATGLAKIRAAVAAALG